MRRRDDSIIEGPAIDQESLISNPIENMGLRALRKRQANATYIEMHVVDFCSPQKFYVCL